jgi:chemotaxis protein CheZ
MDERLKKEIDEWLGGKLSIREIEGLLRLVDRIAPQSAEEGKDAFFKRLAREMRQEMKELALLIMDFKKDFTSTIQPVISEVRTTYIPQATDQLEGIIESTERAANRIMDNLEQMQRHAEEGLGALTEVKQRLMEGSGKAVPASGRPAFRSLHASVETLDQNLEGCLSLIADSFEQMSFQDLTGQRIKRTIDLVNLMEERLRKTLLSFGLKVTEKTKNPEISGDELESTVEKRLSGLSGPQRPGEGLNQADIDKLLASM